MAISDRDQPKPEDVARMNQIERDTIKFLASYRENTEAAIVAGALLRICRHLYDRYPEQPRADLLEGAVAFLLQARGTEQTSQTTLSRVERLGLVMGQMLGKKRSRPS